MDPAEELRVGTVLELRVLQALAAWRAGIQPEDDSVEAKREWPGADKARQLAGLCNRARGADVVLIIGVDDKTGTVRPPTVPLILRRGGAPCRRVSPKPFRI